jgi:hypothetical protein
VIPLTGFGVTPKEVLDSACFFMESTDSVGCLLCFLLRILSTRHHLHDFNFPLSPKTANCRKFLQWSQNLTTRPLSETFQQSTSQALQMPQNL